ncbi:unnamed protein product [Aspergillus oryzae var. brunneus]|uniref:Unnamed protein product n=2 Tax=Aspergillus oryzae TaxID=5062 RepID=A0AAN5BTY4_ASPOZ|nr:unnamed protein product [Aspergillus oryzae]GMG42026.1 unnamed protein product [Aspergillus oryzae var. brunneus]
MVHTVLDRPERRHGNDNADLSDMQYLFAYAENNAAQGNVPWTIRQTCVDIALTLDLSKADHDKDGLIRLLTPQYLGDKLLPLSSRLKVALETVRKLDEINTFFQSKGFMTDDDSQRFASEMAYYKTTIEGYSKSVEVLEGKVKGISDLVCLLSYDPIMIMLRLSNVTHPHVVGSCPKPQGPNCSQ